MARPSKSTAVLEDEKKSHRTKAEIEQRKLAEQALATGEELRERDHVKNNKVAHREFLRVNRLLRSVGKNDALHERIINQYCLMQAECLELGEMKDKLVSSLGELEDKYNASSDTTSSAYYRLASGVQSNILSLDKQVMAKQKMMIDIEKECGMTIASAMRSIPKTVAKDANPLSEVLGL